MFAAPAFASGISMTGGAKIISSDSLFSYNLGGSIGRGIESSKWAWALGADDTQTTWTGYNKVTGEIKTSKSFETQLKMRFHNPSWNILPTMFNISDGANSVRGTGYNFAVEWKKNFTRSTEFFLTANSGTIKYSQSYDEKDSTGATSKNFVTPVLNKRWTGFGIGFKPEVWYGVNISHVTYNYSTLSNRLTSNVNVTSLGRNRQPTVPTKIFTDLPSSMLSHSTKLNLTFLFEEGWDWSLGGISAKNAYDNSEFSDTFTELKWQLDKIWSLTGELGQLSSNNTDKVSTYSSLSVGAEF